MHSKLFHLALYFIFILFISTGSLAAFNAGGRKMSSLETQGRPSAGSGAAHGPNWDYNWGWGSSPGGGWGYGSGLGPGLPGFGRSWGFGSGVGSRSGSGYGYGFREAVALMVVVMELEVVPVVVEAVLVREVVAMMVGVRRQFLSTMGKLTTYCMN
ncbi:hypothetical protein HAX54_001904 [Datura stramonium]|uniref:Glycine-rich protein n=1 Tax=Datura stramonium TaxID=4076 RepID=A0ABS8RST8_DATST|nr:hypothetical protein [Datura stramonium]